MKQTRRIAYLLLPITLLLLTPTADAQTAMQRAKARAAAKKKAEQAKKKPPKINLPVDKAPRSEVSIAPVNPRYLDQAKKSALKIDYIVVDHLKSKGAKANAPLSDAAFMRRVYLDIAGTIPTLEQAESFLTDDNPDKRSALIDELLNSPGYASHHFNYWADALRIVDKPDNNNYLRPYGDWIKQSLRDNTPWNKMVFSILTAEGKVWENPAAGYKLRDDNMPLDNLNNTVRIFLGTRIGCAQCHDHPFDRWTQRDFYELAAFESGLRTRNNDKQLSTARNEANKNRERREIGQINRLVNLNRRAVTETKNVLKFPHDYAYDDAKPGEVVHPGVIFGDMPSIRQGDKREAFANWLTSRENPRFTLTICNRMWERVFGVGLIDPVDDVTEDTDPSIPELMDFLISEMKRVNYDMKEFLRILYNTHIYQRQSTVVDPGDPTQDYLITGPKMRRMSPEQVWDSMLTLTLEDPDTLLRYDDAEFIAAVNLPEGTATAKQLVSRYPLMQDFAREERTVDRDFQYKSITLRRASELPQPVPANHFLRQFGQSDRTIISNNSTDGTVPQLLTMFNGPVTHMMLEPGSLLVTKVTDKPTMNQRIDAIFLSILGRYPSEGQRTLSKRIIAEHKIPGYGDIIWSLLNTREFIFIQ